MLCDVKGAAVARGVEAGAGEVGRKFIYCRTRLVQLQGVNTGPARQLNGLLCPQQRPVKALPTRLSSIVVQSFVISGAWRGVAGRGG